MRVLDRDPNHAKVLQQLGWLHHQQSNSFTAQERAIEYLEKSVASGKTRQKDYASQCAR
jgi:glucose repression mediator protein